METGTLYNNDFFYWLAKAYKRRRKFLYRSVWWQLQSLGYGQGNAEKAHLQLVRSKAVVILNPLMPNTTVQGKIRFMPNQDLVRRIKKEVYDSQSILSQITKPLKKIETNEADSIKFTTEANKNIHDFHSNSKLNSKEQSSPALMKLDTNADTKHNLVLMSKKEDCQITHELVGRRESLDTKCLHVQKGSNHLSTIFINKNGGVKERNDEIKLNNFDPKFSLLSVRVKRLTSGAFFRNKWQQTNEPIIMKLIQLYHKLDKADDTDKASNVFNKLYASRLSVASTSTVANHSHYSKLGVKLDQTDETHSVSTVLLPPSRQPCLSMKNVAGDSCYLKLHETDDTASTVINPHVRPSLFSMKSKTNKTQYSELGAPLQDKFDTASTIVNSQFYGHPSNYQWRHAPFRVPHRPSTRRGGQARYNKHRRGWPY